MVLPHAGRSLALCAGCFLWLASPSALAQGSFDDEDDPQERVERLVALIEAAAEETASRPSVLAGYDPRHASREDRRVARVLRTTRLSVSFEAQPFKEAIQLFREVSGLTFFISRKAREAMESGEPKVTLSVTKLPLENLLNLLATELADYRFDVRYGVVYLMLREEYRPPRVLRIYDVSDLTRTPRHFRAPPLGLDDRQDEGF